MDANLQDLWEQTLNVLKKNMNYCVIQIYYVPLHCKYKH